MSTLSRRDLAFEKDPRRQQEIRLRPIADRVYREVFGDDILVERFEQENNWHLDREFAMDVRLTFPDGLILTGQEKFLSHKYSGYRSITVEYFQDQYTGEEGDWFRLGVQFYFVGYATEDEQAFEPWQLLNWPAVVVATQAGELDWYSNRNKGKARASFRYCLMDEVPTKCVIADG